MQHATLETSPSLTVIHAPRIRERCDSLDLVRLIAALWVVLSHAAPWAAFVNGQAVRESVPAMLMAGLGQIFQTRGETHPAVLAFIVLSGYCVHRNGLRQGFTGEDVRSYAIRRFFRIVPVYLLAVAAGIAALTVSSAINAKFAAALSGTEGITAAGLALRLSGLSALVPMWNAAAYTGNAPLHTVMVEMWLYAAYPLVLALMAAYGERHIMWAIAGIWLVGGLIAATDSQLGNWWHNGSLAGFLGYWWIGALAASRIEPPDLRRATAIAATLWVVATIALMTGATRLMLVVELRKVAFAVLIAVALNHLGRRAVRLPSVLVAGGLASYSLYAFHAPVVYTTLIAGWPLPAAIAAAAITAALAYIAIERPAIELGRRIAAQQVTQQGITAGG